MLKDLSVSKLVTKMSMGVGYWPWRIWNLLSAHLKPKWLKILIALFLELKWRPKRYWLKLLDFSLTLTSISDQLKVLFFCNSLSCLEQVLIAHFQTGLPLTKIANFPLFKAYHPTKIDVIWIFVGLFAYPRLFRLIANLLSNEMYVTTNM